MSHWLAQRVSAVLLLGFLGALAWGLASLPSLSAAELTELLGRPGAAWLAALGLACAYWHAGLGVSVVAEDYIARLYLRQAVIYLSYGALAGAWLVSLAALLALRP